MKMQPTWEKPAEDFVFRDMLCEKALIANRSLSKTTGYGDRGGCLDGAWPGRDHSRTNVHKPLSSPGEGLCLPAYDVQCGRPRSSGGRLGVPLNHPRFLEWLGAPESAWLLEMSPGQWCDTLSRDQPMTAAMRLHRDACLMQTNLDILDQYALALHGMASKLLQKTIGGGPYPVAAAAQGPRARRASVHMEALGLWRPSLDPVQFATS